LGEHLSTQIAELIGRGEFDDEGGLPSELVLTNRFGVSRPVVREALSHLRSMGFIVLYAKRQSSHSQESMLPNKVLSFRGTPYARFQEDLNGSK
jgi:DNA-binding FadR family transcriptional regulator